MAQKKYASLSSLQTFLDNLNTKFATLTHKHTTADLTDYTPITVDTELSSASNNPVANSTLDAEFDAISDAMGALELTIDEKANITHSHSISDVTGLQDTLDTKADSSHTHSEYVPTSRTINSKPLSSDITLSASDVGARPSTWTPDNADVGLGNVANERQYSAQNPPPYPVTSVNGKTGTVSLGAADVGAAPAGYGLGGYASWDAFNNRTNIDDIMANGWHVVSVNYNGANVPFDTGTIFVVARDESGYAHQIAFRDSGNSADVLIRTRTNGTWGAWRDWAPESFAPAGYGLGKDDLYYTARVSGIAALDAITKNGFYAFYDGQNTTGQGVAWTAIVDAYIPSRVQQTLHQCGSTLTLRRYMYNSVWSEWEYENPPMAVGVEYRTTERYAGLPVYTKLIGLGAFSGGEKSVSHGISDMLEVVSISGKALLSTGPNVYGDMSSYDLSVDMQDEAVWVLGDYSFVEAYIILKYLKS